MSEKVKKVYLGQVPRKFICLFREKFKRSSLIPPECSKYGLFGFTEAVDYEGGLIDLGFLKERNPRFESVEFKELGKGFYGMYAVYTVVPRKTVVKLTYCDNYGSARAIADAMVMSKPCINASYFDKLIVQGFTNVVRVVSCDVVEAKDGRYAVTVVVEEVFNDEN